MWAVLPLGQFAIEFNVNIFKAERLNRHTEQQTFCKNESKILFTPLLKVMRHVGMCFCNVLIVMNRVVPDALSWFGCFVLLDVDCMYDLYYR